jgi:E3 ubiquitin-protein ligase TRIP12
VDVGPRGTGAAAGGPQAGQGRLLGCLAPCACPSSDHARPALLAALGPQVLLCGKGERWTVPQLAAAIKFDHGYTATSPPVQALLEVLAELEPPDQRRFLRFVTGCPRLPPGGVGALQPRLTVVRKHPAAAAAATASGGDGGGGGGATPGSEASVVALLADGDLPSVMTCANYIKLPPYSSKAVMRERILFAIREGQGSFDLS